MAAVRRERLPRRSHVRGRTCLAHAEPTARRAHLQQIADTQSVLLLRGIVLSKQLWTEISTSAVFENGAPRVPISLVGAEINAPVRIDGCELRHDLDLTGVSVFTHIELRTCVIHSLVARFGVYRSAALNCSGSTFLGDIDISYSEVEKTAFSFHQCKFRGKFTADGIVGGVHLGQAEIAGDLSFRHAKGHLTVSGAKIDGLIDLANSDSAGLSADRLVAATATKIGPCSLARFRGSPLAREV